jgi:hypothetical protein
MGFAFLAKYFRQKGILLAKGNNFVENIIKFC